MKLTCVATPPGLGLALAASSRSRRLSGGPAEALGFAPERLARSPRR